MKTFTAPLQHDRKFKMPAELVSVPSLAASMREILALLSAVTAAIVIVMTAIWLAGAGFNNFIGAATWGIALVFLAVALDSRRDVALMLVTTSLVLMQLAWLQSTISSEFVIVIGVLMAMWGAVAVFRYLR